MSGAPFRDLFVELPAAVFESLQAFAEALLVRASEPAPPPAYKPPWWRTEYVWRRLAARWGVAEVEIRRRAGELRVAIVFRRRCGHGGRGEMNELALVKCDLPGAIAALDRAFDNAERDCCCMEPPP